MIAIGLKCFLDSYEEQHNSHKAQVKKVVIRGTDTKLTKSRNEIANLSATSGNLHSGILRGD